jgi:hypothetical protein
LKVLTVAGETKVFVNDDGTVSASDLKDMNGEPKKFREIAPMEFRDVHDQDRVAFKRDGSGALVAVIDFPFMVFRKAAWYENSALHLPLAIGSLSVMLLTIVLWPVGTLIRKHYGRPLNLTPPQQRLRFWIKVVCILNLLFALGYVIFFTVAFKDIGMLSPRGNPWIRMIQIVGWLGVLGTAVALYNAWHSWRDSQRWIWARLSDVVIALACVGFTWFIFAWDLLHWSLKY